MKKRKKATSSPKTKTTNNRNSKKHNPIYDIRYSERWRQKSVECRRLINGKCCYPGCKNNSKESHHAMYSDRFGAIAGREIIGEHIFPLCVKHHISAHNKRNWIIDSSPPPKLKSRNTNAFLMKLKLGFRQKLKAL